MHEPPSMMRTPGVVWFNSVTRTDSSYVAPPTMNTMTSDGRPAGADDDSVVGNTLSYSHPTLIKQFTVVSQWCSTVP